MVTNSPAIANDGWMGAALTFAGPRTIAPGRPLRLRYGLYVHSGMPALAALEEEWSDFAKAPLADLAPLKK